MNKLQLNVIISLAIGMLFAPSSCASILELREISNLSVTSRVSENTTLLRITGFAMRSAEYCGRMKKRIRKNKLVLHQTMHFFGSSANKASSHDIDYTVKIPKNVIEVRFGKEETIIWLNPAN